MRQLKLNRTAISLKSLRKRNIYCQLGAHLWAKWRLLRQMGADIANGMTCKMKLVGTSCGLDNQGKGKNINRFSSVTSLCIKVMFIFCGCFTFSLNLLWLTWPHHLQTHHVKSTENPIFPTRNIQQISFKYDEALLAFWRLRTRWSLKLGSRSFVPRPLPNPLQTGASSKYHQFTTGNWWTLLLYTFYDFVYLLFCFYKEKITAAAQGLLIFSRVVFHCNGNPRHLHIRSNKGPGLDIKHFPLQVKLC